MNRFVVVLGALLWMVYGQSATAQTTGDLDLDVTVPNSLGILAPVGPAALAHDGTVGLKSFSPQTFSIVCNYADGATVNFNTVAGFVHDTRPAYKRDAQLNLAISSSEAEANWTVNTAMDQTDIGAGTPDPTAAVQASSTGPGNAELNVTVGFVSGNVSTLIPGTYSITVYGTISAN